MIVIIDQLLDIKDIERMGGLRDRGKGGKNRYQQKYRSIYSQMYIYIQNGETESGYGQSIESMDEE